MALGYVNTRVHRDSSHLRHAVERLTQGWIAEGPKAVAARVRHWSQEAARAGKDLRPVVLMAFSSLAQQVDNLTPWITAAIAAGLTYEIGPLLKANIDRLDGTPTWFPSALAGAVRLIALEAALDPGPNEAAGLAAVESLTADETFLVDGALIRRGHVGHDAVSLALLRHPDPVVRGSASLWFGLDPNGRLGVVPDEAYEDWANAFLETRLQTGASRDNYALGRHLKILAARDPDLVERWVLRQVSAEVDLWHAVLDRDVDLTVLPRANRDRVLRATPEARRANVLQVLLGDDAEWAEALLNGGVIDASDLFAALRNAHHRGMPVDQVLVWAPTFLPRGALPRTVANLADGSWSGSRPSTTPT